jgi:putative acetyltransferase
LLGHPEYYPRFGFRPASRYRIVWQWEVPEQTFMILALEEWKLQEVPGLARYRPEFNSVT